MSTRCCYTTQEINQERNLQVAISPVIDFDEYFFQNVLLMLDMVMNHARFHQSCCVT